MAKAIAFAKEEWNYENNVTIFLSYIKIMHLAAFT